MARPLSDLNHGEETRTVDVLRLGMHFIIRGGWTPFTDLSPDERARTRGQIDRPVDINGAIGRACDKLRGKWILRVHAREALRGVLFAGPSAPDELQRWERTPGRTEADVRALFRDAILSLSGEAKGVSLDVAV